MDETYPFVAEVDGPQSVAFKNEAIPEPMRKTTDFKHYESAFESRGTEET